MLGSGALGKFAITERAGAAIAAAVLAVAGTGTFTPVLRGIAAAVEVSSGAGAYAPEAAANIASVLASAGHGTMTPVLHSFDGAVFASIGISGSDFPGSRIDNRTVNFIGGSDFQSTLYGFFLDAEKVCVHQEINLCIIGPEPRTAIVLYDPNRHPVDPIIAAIPPENRTAIILAEDRVYEIDFDPRGATTPNRKRNC